MPRAVRIPSIAPEKLQGDATVDVKFQPEFGQLELGARLLSDPLALELLLRRAVAETLLKAYRERFLKRLPDMVNMRREHFRRASAKLSMNARERFFKASHAFNAARLSGDEDEVADAHEALRKATSAVIRAVKPPRPSKRPLPNSGTGAFRRLAMKVLGLIAYDVGTTMTAGGGITMGIGPLAALENIRTPSAKPTRSTRNVLWRHLEFGTGVFATDKAAQSPKYRIPGGGWWYGRSRAESLELRGSKAGNFMFDPSRKLPYDRDFVRFRSVLFSMIQKVLSG